MGQRTRRWWAVLPVGGLRRARGACRGADPLDAVIALALAVADSPRHGDGCALERRGDVARDSRARAAPAARGRVPARRVHPLERSDLRPGREWRLLSLPITGSIMPPFTLALYGAEAMRDCCAAFVVGLSGFAAFFCVVCVVAPVLGIATAFSLAVLTALAAVFTSRPF